MKKMTQQFLVTEEVLQYLSIKGVRIDANGIKLSDDFGFQKESVGLCEPMISVIIPTHNRKSLLEKAIDSVLAQHYSNIQLIVIDDCSSDGTAQFIQQKYSQNSIDFYRNEIGLHAGRSRQRGYNSSSGDFVVFLDDDDYYVDSFFFRKAIKIHNEHLNLAFVAANTFIHYTQTNSIIFSPLNFHGFLNGNKYLGGFQSPFDKPHSTFPCVFRKSVLEKADFSKMEMMNDTSIYLRALMNGDAFIMPDFIGTYLVHDSNISKSLNVDFIIQNLEEKHHVYVQSLERGMPGINKDWLARQCWITIKYHLLLSKPDKQSVSEVVSWMKYRQLSFKYKVLVFLLSCRNRIQGNRRSS